MNSSPRFVLYFSRLVVFFVVTAQFQVNALAQSRTISFSSNLVGRPGDEVTIKVSIDNAEGVSSFRVAVQMDPDDPFAFVTDSGSSVDALTALWSPMVQNNLTEQRGFVIFTQTAGIEPALSSGPGVLMSFKVLIKGDAADGVYPLTFDSSLSRLNDGAIPMSPANSTLTISTSGEPPTPTSTYTPTQGPSPTEGASPTQTPTHTPSIKPTIAVTSTPTIDPRFTPTPTNTPRPGNHPPLLLVIPEEKYRILQGQEVIVLVVAYDQDDGDSIDVWLSPNARAWFTSIENVPHYNFTEFKLDTTELGVYSFVVYAYDGSHFSQQEISVEVVSDPTLPTIVPSFTPSPTASSTPTSEPTVAIEFQQLIVTDDEAAYVDLTGSTDFDTVEDRQLTIRWEDSSQTASDWHVYVRTGFGGKKYLGRTGNGESRRYDWYPGEPNLSSEFKNGPSFNSSYMFRVIRIDDHLTSDDFYEQTYPVGFNLLGSSAVKLSNPEFPNLNRRKIVIYDDILGGDDLAPTGGVGMDMDKPSSAAINIAWNFAVDPSAVLEYHVQVRREGEEKFEHLGQTNDNQTNYFLWSSKNEFYTAEKYRSGPQHDEAYQFRAVLLPREGENDYLVSGVLYYYQDVSYFTPTPSPTAPPSPTRTPSATPTSTPVPMNPYTLVPSGPGGNSLLVVLPGVSGNLKPLKLTLIELGTFDMGSPEEERGHEFDETLIKDVEMTRNFYIGTYEVTQGQWRAVMGSNPSWFGSSLNNPVETVSWNDCQAFITELNNQVRKGLFRLPTEAEWEYACRAETQTRFSFGDALDCSDSSSDYCEEFDTHMWWLGNNNYEEYKYGTKEVGLKEPNAFGLFDMHGNVFEWCNDWYGTYSTEKKQNPQGSDTGSHKVVRGGSWSSDAVFCRSAKRSAQLPNNRFVAIGFRLVWQVD